MIRPLLTVAVVAAVLTGTATAGIGDGERRTELRIRAACTGPSVSRLRIEAEDETLRIDFRIDSARRPRNWMVVVIRERRITFRGVLRPARGSRTVRLRRAVADWPGAEQVAVRAVATDGEACRASGVV